MKISTDFACNTNGYMDAVQVYQMDSITQTDEYIDLFDNAVANGLNPNDPAVQAQIFSHGTIDYEDLLPEDQDRLIKAVENCYAMHQRQR